MSSDHGGDSIHAHFPWTTPPLLALAPMRLISTPALALPVTRAGGLAFIGAGTDVSTLPSMLSSCHQALASSPLRTIPNEYPYTPLGVGVITHKASLSELTSAITPAKENGFAKPPCAIWLFAPERAADLKEWADAIRRVKPTPQVWIQAGTVCEIIDSVKAVRPEVVVCQGADAGGHGLQHGSSMASLVPETADALRDARKRGEIAYVPFVVAAGGISEGRGVAAAMAAGAAGVAMGTRFLATDEANVANGYKDEIVRADDGGTSTVRSRVYDQLRSTNHWPERFGGRGVVNVSYGEWLNTGQDGVEENARRYREAEKMGDAGWGPRGRMTTYAGTGVGLVKKISPAKHVVKEVQAEMKVATCALKAKL
ncbi:MAG: hypothetical protein Q9162_002248 [Coniocarpon cinnabarinum]